MTKPVVDVNAHVLDAVNGWLERAGETDRQEPGAFRDDHAIYGLFCAERYLGGWAALDVEGRALFAVNSAYWWWLDDQIDERTVAVAWDAIEHALRAREMPPLDVAAPRELRLLHHLHRDLALRARAPSDVAWWRTATLGTLRGFRDEQEALGKDISLAEKLESGFWSTSMVNVTACASLLLGMGLGDRQPHEPTALERLLGLVARVENDRHSYARDRAEGATGNSAQILARHFGAASQEVLMAFVDDLHRGYERRLFIELDKIGAQHPLALLARSILDAHRAYYANAPRYH